MISDATLGRVLPKSAVDLVGDLIRGLLWGGLVVVWATFLWIYGRMWWLGFNDPASDFTIFYFTARMVADGLPMYGASPAPYGLAWHADHLGNLNPPHFQLLLHPLARLTYSQAFVVWSVSSLIALVTAVALGARQLRHVLTWRRVLVSGGFVVSSAAFTTVVVTWELTFLLMVPFTLGWLAARRGRWTAAGAWLGMCASFKLFFLLFLPWLVLQRRWRAVAAYAASIAACVAAGSLAYGFSSYVAWLKYLDIVGWEWIHMNASWPGFVARVFRGSDAIAPVWPAAGVERPLALIGSVVVCGAAVLTARRLRDAGFQQDLAWLGLFLAAMLASPLGWVYYLPLALGPLVGVVTSGEWRRLSGRTIALVGVAGIGFWVPQESAASGQPSGVATLVLASCYFWATAALWLGTIVLTLKQSASRAVAA